jgi:hypothetical protein
MLKQRMWVFFNPSLPVQSDSTFFCLSFLVWYWFVGGHYSFYILRFDRDAYDAKVEEGAEITDEGVQVPPRQRAHPT